MCPEWLTRRTSYLTQAERRRHQWGEPRRGKLGDKKILAQKGRKRFADLRYVGAISVSKMCLADVNFGDAKSNCGLGVCACGKRPYLRELCVGEKPERNELMEDIEMYQCEM